MADGESDDLPVLGPSLQISFYQRLQALRKLYLHDALKVTMERVDIRMLDDQLVELVGAAQLRRVATFGLRG